MLEMIDKIARHRPESVDVLRNNEVLEGAVLRWIEIIGEAASKVSDATTREHPEVPWSNIVGIRNRLIHGYPTVNLSLVWGVIEDNLATLRTQIEMILEQLA